MTNPLLKAKLPGRVFQLPSKGIFYAPGVLAEHVKNGEVQVKPMSALTELKLRSGDLLYSAKIIREVCEECIPDILKPESLVSRDVDAMFMFLVASTYGTNKRIRAMHNCSDGNGQTHDYMTDLQDIISNPRNSVLDKKEMLYQTKLPSDQIVLLKPVTFLDSIELVASRQLIQKRESLGEIVPHDEQEMMIVHDIMAVIAGVQVMHNGQLVTVTDKKHIEEWIRNLSKKELDQIAKAAAVSAEWGFDFNVKFTCKDCKTEFEYDLDLNPVSFFTE